VEGIGSAETLARGRRPEWSVKNWAGAADWFPGVSEGDMPTKNSQRKHGTTRGSPRRRKVSAHSEDNAYKPLCGEVALCLREGRMGSISDDGLGHYNLDRNEDP
jgi:hypothetical protein